MWKYLETEHLPYRLSFAVIGMFLFTFIGTYAPKIYYRYIDTTPYLMVDSPVNVDKNYFKPCDKVVLTTSLAAMIDVEAVIANQLVLVKDDGTEYQVVDSLVEIHSPIRKAEPHTVSYPYPIPCQIEDGRYFWKGIITYQYKDISKTISFISQTFNITQSGLSPAGEKLIEEKIEESK